MIVLGFDPGGTSGVAILNAGANGVLISTGEVSSVSGAMKWFRESVADEEPMIVGIDAFLHWSLGRGGKRFVDESILKTCYPDSQKSILPQNSTYGAMAVQGMALAIEVRKIWPRIRLNEVHPKVLYFAMESTHYPRKPTHENLAARERFFKCRDMVWRGDPRSEHEFDAAICCYASYQGIRGVWKKDLMEADAAAAAGDYGPVIFPAGNANYYWPDIPSKTKSVAP